MSEPTEINGTANIPAATIICQIALTDDYSIDEAQQALVSMAKCLNRMVGVALSKGTLSVANPITQAVISASGNCETAAVHIAQIREQQRQQSGDRVAEHDAGAAAGWWQGKKQLGRLVAMFPIDDDAIQSPLQTLKDSNYQVDSLACIPYSPDSDIFPQPFLYNLYEKTRLSGRSHLGSLPNLFCGMSNLSPDAICAYLLQQRVAIVGEWRSNPAIINPANPLPDNFEELTHPIFHPLGYLFPSTITRSQSSLANSAFAGYTFFQEAWRTHQMRVLTYLGIAYLFCEYNLVNLHGIRYHDNKLTARWMEQFGFRDIGTIPNYMTAAGGGELVAATVSTLPRSEFEEQLRQVFRELRREEVDRQHD